MDLGRVDSFNDSNYMIAFAPESETIYKIMYKVASSPFMKGMFCGSSCNNFLTFNIYKFIFRIFLKNKCVKCWHF